MDESLNADPFDWYALYIQIQTAGISDPHYHWQNFGNVTIGLIHQLIEGIAKRDKDLAQAMSYTTANLGCYVAHAWFDHKLELKDFLPFMDTEVDSTKITKETAIIFRQLIKDNRIPNRIVSAAGNYMDDIVKLTT